MARRISISQFRSKLRQAQQKQRNAVNKYNQAVRAHNAKVKRAVNEYNSKVRVHNARVRANRDRLNRELRKLSQTRSRPQFATVRRTAETVQRSYSILEERAANATYDQRFDRFLDMSEREAANTASVVNALEGRIPENETEEASATALDHILKAISQDVFDRWHEALFSLSPSNPDAARHFCTSARELLIEILERFAGDDDVIASSPHCEKTQQGKPTRRAKVRYLCHRNGIHDDAITEFVEDDLENIVQLFRVFNDGTHGTSGRFEHSQLLAIRARVECAVQFLWGVITGDVFRAA